MSEGQGHPLGLPTRSTKLWKKSVKKEEDYKPLTPHFCPNIIDEEEKKKCGRFMRNWDIMFYDKYGMCEHCYLTSKNKTENNNDDG
tara:strand:- start:231 stop:488 length:258 start_codon:yes stop_codon:yes gene_type:complete